MEGVRKALTFTVFVTVILLIIANEAYAARGGRFSSYRGGSYRSSRYSSYRSSTYRSTRAGSIAWKTALVSSLYFGSRRYMTRRRYYSNQEPTVCKNYQLSNGTVYGKFVCPLGELPDDHSYCCGPESRQYCCKFFDDGGRIAGVVIGILILFGIIALTVFCCVRCHKNKKKAMRGSRPQHTNNFQMNKSQPPYQPPAPMNAPQGYPAPVMTGYPSMPPQGYGDPGMPPQGYGDPGMPPSYEKSGDLPYSPNPAGYPANSGYNPGQYDPGAYPGYPNQPYSGHPAGLPYPTNPNDPASLPGQMPPSYGFTPNPNQTNPASAPPPYS